MRQPLAESRSQADQPSELSVSAQRFVVGYKRNGDGCEYRQRESDAEEEQAFQQSDPRASGPKTSALETLLSALALVAI